MRAPPAITWTLLTCAAWGCTVGGSAPVQDYHCDVALAPDVAAALAAGAVRQVLPFADPVPASRGAPATRDRDGAFTIAYAWATGDHWLPVADQRLAVDPCTGAVVVTPLAADQRLGAAGLAPTLRLRITAYGTGSLVVGELPAAVRDELTHALDQAFATASCPLAASAGMAEPNLAAVIAAGLLAAARQAAADGRLHAAQSLLQRALRLGADAPCLHFRLGELAAGNGDGAFAEREFAQAALVCTDPLLRARIAAARRDLASPSAPSNEARQRPRNGDDLAAAAARLHTARRAHPTPAADYRLLGELHARGADAFGALAAALLAREYAGDEGATATLLTAIRAASPAPSPR